MRIYCFNEILTSIFYLREEDQYDFERQRWLLKTLTQPSIFNLESDLLQ